MNSSLLCRAAWLLGLAVVLAGFACVLVFVFQSLAGLALLPDVLPSVPKLPSGSSLALAALGAMLVGAAIVRREAGMLAALKRQTEDRLRRIRQYASDVDRYGRLEPH